MLQLNFLNILVKERNSKVKILVNGCNGKMGQEVAKQIKLTEDVDVLCGFDRADSGDNSFPVFTNIEDIDLIPDVIIDFSAPALTFKILEFAKKNNIPTVIAKKPKQLTKNLNIFFFF